MLLFYGLVILAVPLIIVFSVIAFAIEVDRAKPYRWESELPPRAFIPRDLELAETPHQLTAEHIAGYVASNQEFWKTFHGSLDTDWPFFKPHRGATIKQLAHRAGVGRYLGWLAKFPVLKGEFLVATGGAGRLCGRLLAARAMAHRVRP